MNIVCRLGGFHTLMSFLGSIESMMKGSGLEEALERVYGPNVVNHIRNFREGLAMQEHCVHIS